MDKERAKVLGLMVIGALIGGISGAEAAGSLPGKTRRAIELAKTGRIKEDEHKPSDEKAE